MNVGTITSPLGGERRQEILQSVYDGSFFREMTALMLTKDRERREAEKKAAAEDALMALTEPRRDQQKSALEQLRELHIDKLRDDDGDGREIPAELLLVLRAASAVRESTLADELEQSQEQRKVQNDLLNPSIYGTIDRNGLNAAERRERSETGR